MNNGTNQQTSACDQLSISFQGKVLYQIGSDCISNDPPNKENPYKGWTVTIGSARPIRGSSYRTAVMRLSLDWEQMDVKAEQ